MEWRDEGVILSVRRHGETSAIAEIFTAQHGRALGLVRGGRSRQQRPVLQAGNVVQAVWRARLEEQLGTFSLEALDLRAGAIMEEPFRLAGLGTITGLAQQLPEREPHPRLYEAMRVVLEAIGDDGLWPALLVRWELTHVSPRSGKAVSAPAAEPYRDRLFRLPAFLREGGAARPADVIDGLRLMSFFLERHVFRPRGVRFPDQQDWIIRSLAERPH
jgi:DNA repair protein RecO (recombination protein O)